jgi:hypothetical protein
MTAAAVSAGCDGCCCKKCDCGCKDKCGCKKESTWIGDYWNWGVFGKKFKL